MQDPQSINISVIWRGKKFIIGMSPAATIKELGHEMQKLTDVKADTMRLIVPQNSNKSSKLLFPFSDEHERLILRETSIVEVFIYYDSVFGACISNVMVSNLSGTLEII